MIISHFVSISIAFFISVASAKSSVPKVLLSTGKLAFNDLDSLRDPNNGIVSSDDEILKKITDPAIREPHLVVLITAGDPRFGCKVCSEFKPVFAKTAKNWLQYTSLKPEEGQLSRNEVYFLEIDFNDNKMFFQSMDIKNVPHIWVVPNYDLLALYLSEDSSLDPKALKDPKRYQFKTSQHFRYTLSEATSPAEFSRFISQALKINFIAPEEPSELFEMTENKFATLAIIFSIYVFVKKRMADKENTILQKLAQKRIWTGLCVFLICLFCSGYMFTVVRGVPLVARNEKGIFFFAGGSQYQIGMESFVMLGVYLFIGFWMVLLVDVLPKSIGNKNQHREEIEVVEVAEEIVQVEGTEVDEINPKEIKVEEINGEEEETESFTLNENQQSVLVVLCVLCLYFSYSLLTSIYLKKDSGYPYPMSRVL